MRGFCPPKYGAGYHASMPSSAIQLKVLRAIRDVAFSHLADTRMSADSSAIGYSVATGAKADIERASLSRRLFGADIMRFDDRGPPFGVLAHILRKSFRREWPRN